MLCSAQAFRFEYVSTAHIDPRSLTPKARHRAAPEERLGPGVESWQIAYAKRHMAHESVKEGVDGPCPGWHFAGKGHRAADHPGSFGSRLTRKSVHETSQRFTQLALVLSDPAIVPPVPDV